MRRIERLSRLGPSKVHARYIEPRGPLSVRSEGTGSCMFHLHCACGARA